MVVGAVALLILNGRAEGPAENFGFAWLVSSTDAEFQTPATDDVQHRRLFSEADGMPPGQYIGHLSQPDAFGLRGDRRLREQRVGVQVISAFVPIERACKDIPVWPHS